MQEPLVFPIHRTVSYQGVLQQALRDLSVWVERGVEPPVSTGYKVVDAQVEVPPKAGPRKGIQPVVELKVNNGERAEVAVGEPVTFSAMILNTLGKICSKQPAEPREPVAQGACPG